MRKHSEFFGLIVVFILFILAFFIEKVAGVFLDEWLKSKLEPALGLTLAEFLTRFADAVIPMILVAIIIVGLYWYIKHDIETVETKARGEEVTARFDPSDPICFRPRVQVNTANGAALADFYRVRIDKLGTTSAEDCRAFIISVVRNGHNLIAGEQLQIPFSNSTPAHSKRVSAGVPESVDAIYIMAPGYVGTCALNTIGSVNVTQLFDQPGDYEITVAVSAPQQKSRSVKLILSWT